jgi:hypothetical protein
MSLNFYLCASETRGSAVVMLTLLTILAASTAIFIMLVHRETARRRQVILGDWARSRGLRLIEKKSLGDPKLRPPQSSESSHAIDPLAIFSAHTPKIDTLIQGKIMSIVRMRTRSLQPAANLAGPTNPIAPTSGANRSINSTAVPSWNLLILAIPAAWPTTALRPASDPTSAVELFSLASFPALASNQRFVVFGSDSQAAARLARSAARTLLPADIGLILTGNSLILDFSNRTFDQIEFARMLDLAEQLKINLN